MTLTTDAKIFVEARANVLGLRYGERAVLPRDMYELIPCIQMGLIVPVGEDGTVPDPPPVIKKPCGCGS